MNILISAGPTLEPIDSVRFISNRSSGKMGVALAEAAMDAGHEVRVVHGPLMAQIPNRGDWTYAETAVEMMEALGKSMEWADTLIMAAAVCDMRPVMRYDSKVEKSQLTNLQMQYNPDIVKLLAESYPDCHIVSFSLENTLDSERPLKKMRSKNSDWVVYNQLNSMGSYRSTFGIMDRDGEPLMPLLELDKVELAKRLVELLESKLVKA